MIQAKQELLQALAGGARADRLPGSGCAAAFESPKQAAHGDLAITAAMPLARALKKNPRELAQTLVERCSAQPAVQRWVQALEIAGPGFVNLRLTPAAKQAVVGEVLRRGRRLRPPAAPSGQRVMVEFVSANPTGPLHVGHGRQAALGDAICNLFEAQGWQVTREFYYNDAGVQIATLAASMQARLQGPEAGRRRLARSGLQRRLHRRHRGRLPGAQDGARRRPRVHRLRRRGRPGRHPPVRGGLPAPRAGPGPAGVRRALRPLLPRIEPVHRAAASRPRCSAWSTPARPTRRTARCGCAPPTTATTRTA